MANAHEEEYQRIRDKLTFVEKENFRLKEQLQVKESQLQQKESPMMIKRSSKELETQQEIIREKDEQIEELKREKASLGLQLTDAKKVIAQL